MKLLARMLALVIIAALATQPALAAYAACGATSARHICCMQSMNMPVSMVQPATVSIECCPPQAACGVREDFRQQSAAPVAKYDDGNVAGVAAQMPLLRDVVSHAVSGAAADRLARYMLFRVFRI